MPQIVCASAEHAEREGQDGWAAVLGEGDPSPSYRCGACARAEAEAAAGVPVTPAPAEVAVSLAESARAEVAGFSPSSGTRQAVEKLADAVVTLVQGGQS